MELQLIAAIVLVAGSALYLVWAICRSWRAGKTGCASGDCGCKKNQAPPPEILIPSQDLVVRKRSCEPGA